MLVLRWQAYVPQLYSAATQLLTAGRGPPRTRITIWIPARDEGCGRKAPPPARGTQITLIGAVIASEPMNAEHAPNGGSA
jgi:hypothetical protein